jgi:hypothetical protein
VAVEPVYFAAPVGYFNELSFPFLGDLAIPNAFGIAIPDMPGKNASCAA